jgi:4-methyl-5(b-hydroxyethyl)-thiazole monophosphate biosynthesis
MKRVYILLAEGFECVEALAPIDVMNRAGVELKRVAVGGNLSVSSSHGLVSLMCDVLIEDADLSDGDAIILPGGNPGYINLRNSELVRNAVRNYYNSGRLVAAICGAPTVLALR